MTQNVYTTEYVVDNFVALFRDADFTKELSILKVRKFQFLRRRQLLLELRALYIALWRLALGRSFPEEGDHIFETFLSTYASKHPDTASARLLVRARQYAEILQIEGDKNYMHISQHILSFSTLDEQDRKTLGLRLALSIRQSYTFIFDRLI